MAEASSGIAEVLRSARQQLGDSFEGEPSLAWNLGESDILVEVSVNDFRKIGDIRSRLLEQGLPTATWIYTVSYAADSIEPPADEYCAFATFLRVKRSLYRSEGVRTDQAIVQKLRSLVEAHTGIEAELRFCLGSPDLCIAGYFTCSASEFLTFLFKIRSISLPLSDEKIVQAFVTSSTHLCVPWTNESGLATTQVEIEPRVVGKVPPGLVAKLSAEPDVVQELADVFGISELRLLNGEFDLDITFGNSISAHDLLSQLDELQRRGFEKTKTHSIGPKIGTFDFDDEVIGDLEPAIEENQVDCDCSALSEELASPLSGIELLPKPLRREVEAILALFYSAVQDSADCCDLYPALESAKAGLENLLGLISSAEADLATALKNHDDEAARDAASWAARNQKSVIHWCRNASAVLNERRADRFERLFGQRGNVPESRGGLQKILYVADDLLNELWERIDDAMKPEHLRGKRFLVTLFEPTDTILSDRYTGIIRIPSRYAFMLQMVLPQLWHEVGQFLFHNEFGAATSELMESIYAVAEAEDLRRREKREEQNDPAPPGVSLVPSASELLRMVADHYADLLVFHYGFEQNYDAFASYLATLVIESCRYNSESTPVQELKYQELLRRLDFASRFAKVWEKRNPTDTEVRKIFGTKETTFLLTRVVEELLNTPRHRSDLSVFKPTEQDWRRIARLAYYGLGQIYRVGFAGLQVIVCHRTSVLEPNDKGQALKIADCLENGTIQDFSDASATDIFREVFARDLKRELATPSGASGTNGFRGMAALGRSATLYFQQNK